MRPALRSRRRVDHAVAILVLLTRRGAVPEGARVRNYFRLPETIRLLARMRLEVDRRAFEPGRPNTVCTICDRSPTVRLLTTSGSRDHAFSYMFINMILPDPARSPGHSRTTGTHIETPFTQGVGIDAPIIC